MKNFFKSFKLRLFVVIFLITIIATVVLVNCIKTAYSNKAINVKVAKITSELNSMAYYMLTENYFSLGDSASNSNISDKSLVQERLKNLSLIYNGRVLVMNSDFKIIFDSFDTFNSAEGNYFASKEIVQCYKNGSLYNISHGQDKNDYLEVAVPVVAINNLENTANGELVQSSTVSPASNNENSNIYGVIYASVCLNDINEISSYVNKNTNLLELIIFFVVAIWAIIFTFVLAGPFSKIATQIKNFVSFDEGEIDASIYSETKDIAIAFNELKVRIKVLDDSRQEFVSNVSHELKTPITSIKVLADSINEQEDVPNELYREFMQDIVDEIDRENTIISDLLSLVKLDKGDAALNITTVDVNEMLELIMKRLVPIADKNGVELLIEPLKDVKAEIDDVKMTLALTNLIENGIKYNVDGGWVNVALDSDNQYMIITIQDSGIGIAEEELDHIFERFYRVDKSHSREIGGTGLGLAIARKTILLHRGSIKVESDIGVGTTFTVRIPLTYANNK